MKLKGTPIKGFKLDKNGKLTKSHTYRDASAAIRAKTSKRQKPVRRSV